LRETDAEFYISTVLLGGIPERKHEACRQRLDEMRLEGNFSLPQMKSVLHIFARTFA
jgi:hypothetical protein